MNFVFLSPHFPPNFYLFCIGLRKAGINVLGIGDCEFDQLRPELRDNLSWYFKVSDLHNYEELKNACLFFEGKFGRLDGLDSLTEYWLETESRLRTDFNIPGIKTDAISRIRRKSAMKEVFYANNIPCAKGMIAHEPAQAHDFASGTGFPAVIKPDDGVGAAYTYKITSHEDIDAFFTHKPDRSFIMEEFVDGDIVTFDGLADSAGDIVFCTSHFCYPPPMEAIRWDSDIYYYSLRDIPQDLRELGLRTVKAFDVRSRFFHFEFFRLKNGSLKACEVNMRPPGGMTVDMMNFARDFNMYDIWARVMAGENFKLDYSRKYHSCYISRKNSFNYLHSYDDVNRTLAELIVHQSHMPHAFSHAMGDYGYIVRSADLNKIKHAIDYIQGHNSSKR